MGSVLQACYNAIWFQLQATAQVGQHEHKIEIPDPISHCVSNTISHSVKKKFLDKDTLLFRTSAWVKMIQFALSIRSAEAAT